MTNDVAIIGVGLHPFGRFDKPAVQMGAEAIRLALALHEIQQPVQLAALYPHRNLQDPKIRLFLDFMAERCQKLIRDLMGPEPGRV